MPEHNLRQADIKRACISKIAFNAYGDRVLASNLEGNIVIYQVEANSKAMRKIPIFSLYEQQDMRHSDFDQVSDTVLACVNSKKIRLFDLLLPYAGRMACQNEFKMAK